MADALPSRSSPRRGRQRGRRGEGSVWWEPERQRWRGSLSWRDANGQRRRREVVAPTREEAQAALLRLRLERLEGERERAEAVCRTTLGEWCATWVATELPRLAIGNLTARDYRQQLALVARSPQADIPLPDLGIAQVEALLAWRLRQAPSRTSVRLLRSALSRALGDAQRQGLIAANPARLARLPAEARPAKERKALTPEQVRALESVLEGEPDEALWLSMLLLGLRPGEAAGLTWADVDTDAGVLHVAGARKWTPEGYVLGPPKTRRAKRALKMPERLTKAFRQMERGGPHDLVFPSPSGKLREDSVMRNRLARLCERAGIPRMTPYELRHTAASLLSDAGVPIEVVADLLGHSTTQMLESVYRHRVRKIVDPGVW